MIKREGSYISMGIIVSRKKRMAMAPEPPRPEPLPQSQPNNQESSAGTQEDVLRSNDDEKESDSEEKSEASDESDSETHTEQVLLGTYVTFLMTLMTLSGHGKLCITTLSTTILLSGK